MAMAREKLVTHYDNLKVARNAPVEVIRAAYRALAQQFHPDKFPDRLLAEHRMKVINKAYEVLSDPDKRRVHDSWIAEQETLTASEGMRHATESVREPRAQARSGGGGAGQFDDAARFRHDTVTSRTDYDYSTSGSALLVGSDHANVP